MNRVLLIDDDEQLGPPLSAYFQRFELQLTQAVTPSEALERLRGGDFDAVILDVMLPGLDGWQLLQIIRRKSQVPVLFLTARDQVEDRVRGLELGADDYLVKPFSPRELVARLRALLRRAKSESEPQRSRVEYGPLEIDLAGHKVFVDGTEVDLTASEYKLLTTLSRYPGRVYSRMELVEKVLGYDFEGYERAIDSHIKNLRAKLDDDPREPRFVHTVFGVGYRFEPPVTPQ